MASIWTDTLVRFLQDGYKPRRTVKMALTCGEETSGAFNGAEYLTQHQRELIDAAFALNEGAWGTLDDQGRRIMITVQAGEKASQNYRLEVRNPGGHSSRPVKDNAIYRLAAGLTQLSPVRVSDPPERRDARVLHAHGGPEGRRHRRGDARAGEGPHRREARSPPSRRTRPGTRCCARPASRR